eukprot:CAMPEP_0185849782 /NCGR_PEP_ID=MMETSP1354-20130828/4178_1 /TAXON_ID=708628 /ORGANISM="Erythrolobus madagascarensis, Strain CCMP3276" /LENGTH=462 /DNA_ID=CAMNT_0028550383 /DNA_START=63 /DNA_END=1451 /DNA_ORIENTATION=+
MEEDAVVLKGWLLKESGVLHSKTRKLFQLTGTVLSAASDERSKPQWSIKMWGCVVSANPAGAAIGSGAKIKEITSTFSALMDSSSSSSAASSAGHHHHHQHVAHALREPGRSSKMCIHVHGDHMRDAKLYAESDADFDRWLEALKYASGTALHDFYLMGKEIGSGTYGKVYLAINRKTNEEVAVKAVKKINTPKEIEYMQREVRILTAVSHPHVVRTIDIFDLGDTLYFVMELLPGGELFDLIAEAKHFTEAQAAEVARQLMSGIAYLHDLGIVHRDIKPENILATTKTFPLHVKLTDFGLSNVIPFEKRDSAEHALRSYVGTPNYIAGELLLNKPYGPAVDVFSAGVVLYIMLSGKFPFWGRTDEEYLARLRRGARFPAAQWAGVSDDAKDLLTQMTAFDPKARPSAEQVLAHSWFEKLDDEEFLEAASKIETFGLHSRNRQKIFTEAVRADVEAGHKMEI